MPARRDTDEQRRILEGLRQGRILRPVAYDRGKSRVVVRMGFSDREPIHGHALDALVRQRRVAIRDGRIVTADQEAGGQDHG